MIFKEVIFKPISIKLSSLFLLIILCNTGFAQKATVFGTVRDSLGKALPVVNVSVESSSDGAVTKGDGSFELTVDANTDLKLQFTFIGYKSESILVNLKPGERKRINVNLNPITSQLPEFTIQEKADRVPGVTRIDPKTLKTLPNPSGNFEAILKTLPGVASNNELSSTYSVRGGNYDENLVYVNDIEIYRPFLVRSGQQEGLSFINSDLVSSVQFSAGGFNAQYGDKLSSALDIKYRKPKEFGASANLSLLGANAHVENLSKNGAWTYILGVRQKSNKSLLNSLDTEGDYNPSFSDVQTYITWDVNEKWELSALGNYSRNLYRIIPQNRTTDFGTVNQALRLRVFFDGQEIDEYQSGLGAFTAQVSPNKNLKLKFITSVFKTSESESFDILGQYFLDELEKDIGSDNFGNVAFNLGVGSFLDHARTQLDALVYNAEHKGTLTKKYSEIKWGTRFQREEIDDKLREWQYVDSSDYSIPQAPDDIILLQNLIDTRISLNSNRINAFIQDTWYFSDTARFSLTAGIRATYWDLNEQLLFSPRASLNYKPDWKHKFEFRIASGFYYQPPFYRELRNLEGNINKDLKAQESMHIVLGSDYYFLAWGREFKFTSELYYKSLKNLVPYKVDNVRIKYYGTNNSDGYSTGIDMRVNGEFVPGVESWASLSVLSTREDLRDDFYYKYYNSDGEEIVAGFTSNSVRTDSLRIEPGSIPRPTDQRVSFALFFQDYLPKFPSYKMNLSLIFGTGIPFGPPGKDKYKDILRMPSYRRVDIGFSKELVGDEVKNPFKTGVLKSVKNAWVSLEVFNLLQVNNTVSYLWIRDVNARQYAVPNFLTSRQLNFRLNVIF